MPVLKITVHDILTERLSLALQQISECDTGEELQTLRWSALEELRKIEEEGASAGYSFADLYEYVIAMEEGRTDLAAYGPWGNGQLD